MTDEARDLGLVHRIDHRRRCAGAAERVADVDNLGDAGAFAAEFARHRDAKQALGARGGNGLVGKPRVAVDRRGMLARNGGDLVGARHRIGGAGNAQAACRGENAARGAARRFDVLIDF